MKTLLKTVFLLLASVNVASHACGQVAAHSTDTTQKKLQIATFPKPKGPKAITKEMSIGFRLNSDGWSIYADRGKVKPIDMKRSDMFHNVRLWQIEFTEKKNPKEYKSTSVDGSGTNTYVYGKINNFYALKLGWGYRKMLAGKPDPGTVSIHWVNTGGLAIGFLKPYYLNVYSDPAAIKYSDATKQDFLNQSLIEGNAGFSKGIGEVKIVPGFHFKSAIHFDFSTNKKNVIGIETGFNVEYYTTAVQLMANQPAVPYFADLFLALQFGKRW